MVDIVQTLIDLAGGIVPEDWNGDSMKAYLADGSIPWKDYALSEYYGHNIASGITMIRQKEWKYVYHNRIRDLPPDRELFNLREDPKELHNLADIPKYREKIQELHKLLVKELGEDPDAIETRYLRTHRWTLRITRIIKKWFA